MCVHSDFSAMSIPILNFPMPHVGRVQLRRPDAANRLEVVDLEALSGIFADLRTRGDCHVLVLASEGRAFSAGFDLREMQRGGAKTGSDLFERVVDQLEALPMITLAAVHGPVAGGSTDLALACDLRIGGPEASMFMPAARFGLPLYAGALQRYVDRLGLTHAMRLVFTAGSVSAEQMLEVGYLSELVLAGQLEKRVDELVTHIASMPSEPLRAMKQVLRAAALGQARAPQNRSALDDAFKAELILSRVAEAGMDK
jgi:enoyl-CoA hydratase